MFENMQHVKCELFSQKGNRICKANPLTKLHHQTAETEQYNTPISHKTCDAMFENIIVKFPKLDFYNAC